MGTFGGFCVSRGRHLSKERSARSKNGPASYKFASNPDNPRNSTVNGITVRKLGALKFVMASLFSSNRPSFFMRSNRAVVGGACRTPAIAQGMAVRSINSRCRSKMSAEWVERDLIKCAIPRRQSIVSILRVKGQMGNYPRYWSVGDHK